MGDNLRSDGLDVPGPVLAGTRDTENNVPRPRIDILLNPTDAAFHRSQQAVVPYDVQEITAVDILASQLPSSDVGCFLFRGVDRDVGKEKYSLHHE